MLAKHVVLDQYNLLPIPSHMDYRQAASLPVAGLTAFHCLFGSPLKPYNLVKLFLSKALVVYPSPPFNLPFLPVHDLSSFLVQTPNLNWPNLSVLTQRTVSTITRTKTGFKQSDLSPLAKKVWITQSKLPEAQLWPVPFLRRKVMEAFG